MENLKLKYISPKISLLHLLFLVFTIQTSTFIKERKKRLIDSTQLFFVLTVPLNMQAIKAKRKEERT